MHRNTETLGLLLWIVVALPVWGCSSDEAVDAGTDCDQVCPVGAQKMVSLEADGSCGADGSYSVTGATAVSGACFGHGECQVICLYPECSEGNTLVITKDEYRCEAVKTDPCDGVDCDDHGTCMVVYDAPVCFCDEGYKANGTHCPKDEEPVVLTVTPPQAVVGLEQEFLVKGLNLPDTLAAEVDKCEGLSFTMRSDTEQRFVCTPQVPGVTHRRFYQDTEGIKIYNDEASFVCTGCEVVGQCTEAGMANPDNPCQKCDPETAAKGWTDLSDVACDDGVFCNGEDICLGGVCAIHSGQPCPDDGVFCNGTELCDEELAACTSSGTPCPDDGNFCNGVESCDDQTGACAHSGDPCADDGMYCNGEESCDAAAANCAHSGDPCNDDGLFCNGIENCAEDSDTCVSTGDPCPDDSNFCNGDEFCDEWADMCKHSDAPCPDDGNFCNGVEDCDPITGACIHTGNPCVDDGAFCNGLEVCDALAHACTHSGNPCLDDGVFCNGSETCNEMQDQCEHSGNPCVDDGQFCTGLEKCNEADKSCYSTGDPCQEDGIFCNGIESCDAGLNVCVHSGDPCPDDGVFCNGAEKCDETTGACTKVNVPCLDDGYFCNGFESCLENSDSCVSSGDPCVDDGLFCNGGIVCDAGSSQCLPTDPPCQDDAVFCNGAESCSEEDDQCLHAGNPCADNGQFCDGKELCDEGGGQCIHSGNPCQDDGAWCNGAEICDEAGDKCNSTGNPCVDDKIVCNGKEICDEVDDQCVSSGNPCQDDGVFCNGPESCQEETGSCVHGGNPCPEDETWCNGSEWCDEYADQCKHTGDPCEDDGQFCNGDEFCNGQTDLCDHTGDPCGLGQFCTEAMQYCAVEIPVLVSNKGSQERPDVTMFDDGRAVVVWQSDKGDGNGYDVWARFFSAQGVALTPEIKVNQFSTDDQRNPTVDIGPEGESVWIAWESTNPGTSFYKTSKNEQPVMARMFHSDGQPATDEIWANPTKGGNYGECWPRIVVSSHNTGMFERAFVAYQPVTAAGLHTQVVVEAVEEGGAKYGYTFYPNGSASQHQGTAQYPLTRVSIAATSHARIIITWGHPNLGLLAREYYSTTQPLTDIIEYMDKSPAMPSFPRIGGAFGRFGYSAFSRDSGGADGQDVVVRRVNFGYEETNADFTVENQTLSGAQVNPDIVVTPNGEFVVVWESQDQDGSGKGVFLRRGGGIGVALGQELQVNWETSGDQYEPAVDATADGSIAVVWTNQTGGLAGKDVILRLFPLGSL